MDFKSEVLEKSKKVPVVVDFWAPWCGPCKFLGPVIEELADQSQGKWELVKVNTDDNQDIAGQYRIQGIPAVKMFHDQEVIAEFTGALSKHQIERWLDQNLPDKRKKEFKEIIERVEQNGRELDELEKFVKKNPDFLEGKVELARILSLRYPLKATQLVKDIKPGNPFYPKVEDILTLEALVTCRNNEEGILSNHILNAQEGIEKGDIDQTLDALIQAVMIDKHYCEELFRKSAIAIFNLLGKDHELTRKYRKRFDMALY